jgi:hypothetical protein
MTSVIDKYSDARLPSPCAADNSHTERQTAVTLSVAKGLFRQNRGLHNTTTYFAALSMSSVIDKYSDARLPSPCAADNSHTER